MRSFVSRLAHLSGCLRRSYVYMLTRHTKGTIEMPRESGYTEHHQPSEARTARVTNDSRRFFVGQVKIEARMLLPPSHLSPSALLASILSRFRTPDGRVASHGVARFVRIGDRLDHITTELTYQLDRGETPEAFSARVWADAQDGDWLYFVARPAHGHGLSLTS